MKELQKSKETWWKDHQEQVQNKMNDHMKHVLLLASEKGASTWLTSLPLKRYGFRLNKQQFWDAVCIRYDLQLKDVPKYCQCGQEYSINHCLSCKKGGYIIIRHNAVRDTLAELLGEICKDVKVEPSLLPVTGENLPTGTNSSDGARADVSAIGLWQPLNKAFIDVKVFNPLAMSNAAKELSDTYKDHEKAKKRSYNARIIEVEKGTFTPAIFSCSGGASPEATHLLKTIAAKLAVKRSESYQKSITFVRRRVAFDILRTCIISAWRSRIKTK